MADQDLYNVGVSEPLPRDVPGEAIPVPERIVGLLRKGLARGQSVRLRARGTSMAPLLRGGDVVTLVPLPEGPVRVGAVVGFLRAGKWLILHRIVGRQGDAYLLRGDAAPRADGEVARGELVGLVEGVERRGHPVRVGSGAAGAVVAALSRAGLLRPLSAPWRLWLRAGRRRSSAGYNGS